ncbi:hypothetical protein VNO78_17341 [Psophocarpus tetragonolobus]|uniref:Uncharacterized protein n=1 Tax=Psophocarpus tetragonolobus TaxID=3891 RepID=A0AAN9SNC0_PSOTE
MSYSGHPEGVEICPQPFPQHLMSPLKEIFDTIHNQVAKIEDDLKDEGKTIATERSHDKVGVLNSSKFLAFLFACSKQTILEQREVVES